MRFAFDTLKCARLLKSNDFKLEQAEAFAEVLSTTEITNLYSKHENDVMLSEMVEKVFREEKINRERGLLESEKRFELASTEVNRRLSLLERQSSENTRQMRNTIITVGLALAGYLSALIHFTH